MRKSKKSKHRQQEQQIVTGVAWYTPEGWQHLKRVAADKGHLHDSYDGWWAEVLEVMQNLRAQGLVPVQVEIDIDELVAWCRAHNKRIDGKSRSEFTTYKLQSGSPPATGESGPLEARRVPKRQNPLPLLDRLEKAFERARDRSTPPPYPYDEAEGIIRLPQTIVAEVRMLIRAGKKPEAVKRVAYLTGAGLRVAKDYVDGLAADPRSRKGGRAA